MTFTGLAMVIRHGPNRHRWFTELQNSMVIFHGELLGLNSQRVYEIIKIKPQCKYCQL